MNALNALSLSANEKEQLAALKLSRELYLNRIHRLRIQYMKHLVLENFLNGKTRRIFSNMALITCLKEKV
jgi:hypothetical protein